MGLEFAHRYGQCPIVFTNHTRYDLYLKAYAKIPSAAAKHIMGFVWPKLTQYCDTVVVPAASTGTILRNFGVEGPIRVIPNGIELPKFISPLRILKKSDLGLSEDSILVINVGRISSEKNISFLLTEFSFANRINRRLHLALVGNGPMTNQIRQSVQRLGLGDNVHLIGEVKNDHLPAYLAAADFFATASTSEVHPLTLIEAMASSLPIVAVSSPGTTEIVSDELTGLLAEERAHDLADKMIILAANSSLRAKFSNNSFVASKNYDIRLTISRSLSLYEELLANGPSKNN
jgi:glycosyltransferase involved in cell wall biosynthesis